MKQLVWLLKWLLKAAIFFALFAFALNNQQDATVHFFFGTQWRTPLVLVVLAIARFARRLHPGLAGLPPGFASAAHRKPTSTEGLFQRSEFSSQ